MELFFIIILALGLGAGCYMILSAAFKLPLKSKKVQKNTERKEFDIEKYSLRLARRITPYVRARIKKDKNYHLKRALEATNKKESIEEWLVSSWIKISFIFLIALIAGMFNGIFFVLFFVLGILFHIGEKKNLVKEYKKVQKQIDEELPALARHIDNEWGTNKDVLSILERYNFVDNRPLSHELERTIADMRSSSPENGLLMLGKRVDGSKMNQIIQGLLGVLRGEDQGYYFKMLVHDFDTLERNALFQEVDRLPDKLQPFMLMLCVAFIMLLLSPMIGDIVKNMHVFFN